MTTWQMLHQDPCYENGAADAEQDDGNEACDNDDGYRDDDDAEA